MIGGTPVRGKFLKTMLRYDLRPVRRACQNGELVDRQSTCGSRYRATFIASMRKSLSSMPT